jgi:hypothetical protein
VQLLSMRIHEHGGLRVIVDILTLLDSMVDDVSVSICVHVLMMVKLS